MQLQFGADLNIDFTHLSEKELMSKITQARKKLRHAQSQAAELIDKMLEEMTRDRTTHGNLDTAAIIKNIWHREEVKTSFRIMQPIAKGKTGGT
eukprot:2641131-Ditylum_brightwellii.AAC.1